MNRRAYLNSLLLVLTPVVCRGGRLPQEENLRVKRFEVRIERPDYYLLENTYLLINSETKEGLIIDPGTTCEALEKKIEAQAITIKGILNTHGHGDHIEANSAYAEKYGTEVYAHAADKPYFRSENNRPTRWIEADKELKLGSFKIKALHTPGHSPGSTCYLIGGHLFSGDTLFKGSIGKTPNDDVEKQMINGIKKKLLTLPPETKVYSGHGESSTIGTEKKENPFL